MIIRFSKITIIKKKDPDKELNKEIQWLCNSLGLFSERDREKSCYRIFLELIKTKKQGLSSDELAFRSNLSRATAIHHLNKLMDSGLVVISRNRYSLREKELNKLVLDIKKDINNTLKNIEKVAKKIDKELKY